MAENAKMGRGGEGKQGTGKAEMQRPVGNLGGTKSQLTFCLK